MIALEIRPAILNQLFPEDVKAINLSGVQVSTDRNLENLFALMETDIQSGCSSGRLYAEGLCMALVAYLIRTYAIQKPLQRVGNKLSPLDAQTVTSYVREHLTNDLSIVELAKLVHLSPYHFARLFKVTMGKTPHSFVLEQRVLEAHRLLRLGRSVTEVAHVTGFASHAHLSNVFRRRFGVSPIKLRKQASYG